MDEQRLDKWLWCTRFLKTRSLAHDTIKAGRVSVNGVTAKPAKTVSVGDEIVINQPPYQFIVQVLGIAAQRVSAPLARTLYAETAASLEARESLAETLRLGHSHEDRTAGKLSKRDRRAREAMKRDSWRESP
ncbi:MAG: RNA-binding S4 domain-containing protein [Gammaproteobacteria bacterium]|nr:RNA-binding S4 domain-containing protein [Gammaproteobacteria bacterium]